jgi:predicted phosphohydrolase
MKVRYMSDLHLEFADMYLAPHEDDKHSILVLAGDTCVVDSPSLMKSRYQPFFGRVAAQFRFVVLVMGNHEHYGCSFRRTLSKLRDAISELNLPNIVVLEKEAFVVDHVAFIGATLWTDCDKFSPHASYLWNSMADSKTIRTGPNETLPYERKFKAEDSWTDHTHAKRYIWSAIEEQKAQGRKVVVISHHAPTPMSIHRMYVGDPLNMFYYSDLVNDIMDYDPDFWIHGHVHTAFDYLIDSTLQICQTRVLCNPRGYEGHESAPELRGFNMNASIEL